MLLRAAAPAVHAVPAAYCRPAGSEQGARQGGTAPGRLPLHSRLAGGPGAAHAPAGPGPACKAPAGSLLCGARCWLCDSTVPSIFCAPAPDLLPAGLRDEAEQAASLARLGDSLRALQAAAKSGKAHGGRLQLQAAPWELGFLLRATRVRAGPHCAALQRVLHCSGALSWQRAPVWPCLLLNNHSGLQKPWCSAGTGAGLLVRLHAFLP